jgi:cytochrome c551/c552
MMGNWRSSISSCLSINIHSFCDLTNHPKPRLGIDFPIKRGDNYLTNLKCVLDNMVIMEKYNPENKPKRERGNRWMKAVGLLGLAGLGATYFLYAADPSVKVEGKIPDLKVDASKLPPPSTKKIDFAKEIKPLFKKACIDCHDADNPMGGFSLNKRESALKGGEKGLAIIPGKSDKSPIIYYVARQVKELPMPPKDMGDPLTKEEISLLRAWIDQGAKWD